MSTMRCRPARPSGARCCAARACISHIAEWRKAPAAGAREGFASKAKPRRSAEQVEPEKLRRKTERLEAELERTMTALEITRC